MFDIFTLLPLLFAGTAFLIITIIYRYLEKSDRAKILKERLSTLAGLPAPIPTQQRRAMLLQHQRKSLLERNFGTHLKKSKSLSKLLKSKLLYSPVKIPLWQSLLIGATSFFAVSRLAGHLLQQGALTNNIAGALVAVVVMVLYTDHIKGKREKEFSKDFTVALDVIIRALKAGISIERAFNTAGQEIRGPVGAEFQRIVEHINFGVPFETALQESAERVGNNDFNFFVVSLIIQRKTGGGVADLILSIRNVIRQRQELRLKIKALSSEAKASGIIVGALPILLLIVLSFLSPDYVDFFRSDPLGQKLIMGALGLIMTGAYIIKKLVNFEV